MEIRMKVVTLTEQQMQNLMGLVDQSVRATGLRSVIMVAELIPIFENAVALYKQEQAKQQEDKKDGNFTNS